MEPREVVHATIGCLGTVHIGADPKPVNQEQPLYDLLASTFGDLIAGWEQGDTLYLGVGTGTVPVEKPRPDAKPRARPSDERIEAGVQGLIDLVQMAKSMDAPLSADDSTWQPTKQGRARMRTMVEIVLRGDAAWCAAHPEGE